MSGRAFGPRFTFIWPTAKIAVMGPKQMAGVMTIVGGARANGADRVRRGGGREARRACEYWAEERSQGLFATSRVSDDGMIDPADTRTRVAMALSACHSRKVEGDEGYAVGACSGCKHRNHHPAARSPTAARSPAASSHGARHGHRTVAVYADGDAERPFVREADRRSPSAALLGRDLPRCRQGAGRRGARAPTPSIPATASSPRTPTSPAVEDAGLVWVGPSPTRSRPWATSCRPSADAGGGGADAAGGRARPGDERRAAAARSAIPCWSRRPPAAAARACGSSSRSGARGGGRRRAPRGRLAFGDDTVFLERWLRLARTSRSRSSATSTATWCTASSASARSSGATRRSSRRRRRRRSDELRARMGAAAVAAGRPSATARRARSSSCSDGDDFWFLEVNTRLQVEHPVTEEITGSIWCASSCGSPGRDARLRAGRPSINGHAIEARLYAEDPEQRLPAGDRHGAAWEPSPRPSALRLRHRDRQRVGHRVRPDARQGHRARAHPAEAAGRWRGCSRPRACRGSRPTGTSWWRRCARRSSWRRHHHRLHRAGGSAPYESDRGGRAARRADGGGASKPRPGGGPRQRCCATIAAAGGTRTCRRSRHVRARRRGVTRCEYARNATVVSGVISVMRVTRCIVPVRREWRVEVDVDGRRVRQARSLEMNLVRAHPDRAMCAQELPRFTLPGADDSRAG